MNSKHRRKSPKYELRKKLIIVADNQIIRGIEEIASIKLDLNEEPDPNDHKFGDIMCKLYKGKNIPINDLKDFYLLPFELDNKNVLIYDPDHNFDIESLRSKESLDFQIRGRRIVLNNQNEVLVGYCMNSDKNIRNITTSHHRDYADMRRPRPIDRVIKDNRWVNVIDLGWGDEHTAEHNISRMND